MVRMSEDMRTEMNPADVIVPREMGLGVQLRLARERAGLGLDEVARNLHVTDRVIESLEDEHFDELPPPIFVRGYLRQYAALLHMPPEDLVHLYNTTYAERPAPLIRESLRQRLVDRQFGFRIWPVLTVLVVVATLLGIWIFGGQPKLSQVSDALQEKPASEATPHAGHASIPAAHKHNEHQRAEPGPAQRPQGQEGQGAREPQSLSTPVSTPIVASQGQQASPAAVPGEQQAQGSLRNQTAKSQAMLPFLQQDDTQHAGSPPPASAMTPAVPGEREVQFQFSKDCWIEVHDADGRKVLATMGRTGETRSIRGKAPLSVLLGNAGGVAIRVDGKKYDFTKYVQKSQLARFRIPAADQS